MEILMHHNDTPQLPLFTIVSDDLPPIVPIPSKHIKDLTGQRFGRLSVLGWVGKEKGKVSRWLCQCDCGNRIVTFAHYMTTGDTSSCGCLRRDVTGNKARSHGLSNTVEYRIWFGIIDRCRRVTNKSYTRYGGRGITVCQEWQDSFEQFLTDIGNRPSPKHSVERIDNALGYFPDNCRWATNKEQANNTRRNHIIEYNGEKLNLAQWSEKTGMSYYLLRSRASRGWSPEKIFTRPIGRW
jgi:hypothetical protein